MIDVEAAPFVGYLGHGKPSEIGLQAAVGYRPQQSYSLGGVASIARPFGISCTATGSDSNMGIGAAQVNGCDSPTWARAAFEARWYPLATRIADAWLGLEAGVALEAAPPASRFAPLAGAGAGVAFFLVPAFSIGLETRANLSAYDAHSDQTWGLRGVTPAVFAGIVSACTCR